MYRQGGVIGKSNIPTTGAASGLWKINEIQTAELDDSFPFNFETSHTISLNTVTAIPVNLVAQTSNDNNRNFDIVDVNFTAGGTTSHRPYIGLIPRGGSSFYNDLCIGAFQIIQGSSTLLTASTKGGNDITSLATTVTQVSGSDTNPTNETFYGVATGTTARRWNSNSSTGSSSTGATDGIADGYSNTTILPSAGLAAVAQVSSKNYLYPETSGSSNNNFIWLRSAAINLTTNTAHTLRIAYHFGTASSQITTHGVDGNSSLYVYMEN